MGYHDCVGKRRFKNERKAAAALEKIARNPRTKWFPNRAYYCLHCRGWHITRAALRPLHHPTDNREDNAK